MARKPKTAAEPAPQKPQAEPEKPVITLMRHTLGMDQYGFLYRNSCCVEKGSDWHEQFKLLTQAGLAEQFDTYGEKYLYFRLTPRAAEHLTQFKVKPKDIADAGKYEEAEKARRKAFSLPTEKPSRGKKAAQAKADQAESA